MLTIEFFNHSHPKLKLYDFCGRLLVMMFEAFCVIVCVNLAQVSAAVCFLLSPAAAFINGETIRVDGAHSLYAPSVAWQVPGIHRGVFDLLH